MPRIDDTARAFMPYPDVAVAFAATAATGPLAGLSFAVKDLFHVAGYPTSGGQPLLLAMSGIQTRTAPAVQCLLDAGAAFAGKTITDELAFSMNGNNAHFGAPLNGAAPDRICGGSSSGSAAAVSSSLVDFALGTDTGGSVRAPANHCGLVGLRPTHGRIPLRDCLDLAPSLDTCGWFARELATFARVADVLLGADTSPLPARPRLLLPADVWGLLAPDVAQALTPARAALESTFGAALPVTVALDGFDAMYWHYRHIQGREAWLSDGPFITRYEPPLGPGVAERFAWSSQVSDEQVAAARAFRSRFTTHLADLLGDDGVLLMPTMPDIAPLRTETDAALDGYRNQALRMLCIAGLSGRPQLSLPWATRLGAPLGISLLGPAGSDRSLVAWAQYAQSAQPAEPTSAVFWARPAAST